MSAGYVYRAPDGQQVTVVVPDDVQVPASIAFGVKSFRVEFALQPGVRHDVEVRKRPTRKPSTGPKGTRVDPNFVVTDEMRAWAAKEVPLVDVTAKLPEFIDYWIGVSGSNGVKTDWEATWRNGMRKQQQFALRDRARDMPKRPAPARDWMNR